MSTSQKAMMLCGWGVKAGMACLQIKLCVAISQRYSKCTSYLKALYKMSTFTLLLLYFTAGCYRRNLYQIRHSFIEMDQGHMPNAYIYLLGVLCSNMGVRNKDSWPSITCENS